MTNVVIAILACAVIFLALAVMFLNASIRDLQRDIADIREREHLARLSASEVAGYYWPGEDQQEMRAAFIEGAVYRAQK